MGFCYSSEDRKLDGWFDSGARYEGKRLIEVTDQNTSLIVTNKITKGTYLMQKISSQSIGQIRSEFLKLKKVNLKNMALVHDVSSI